MDKFVVAIPRGGGAAAAASQKRKLAGAGAGAGASGGGGASKLARPAAQPQQMYLDLGQKSFGANKHCGLCGMLYVVGDVDDEKRHTSFCSKAKAGPSLTSIKGLTELARFDDDGRDAVVVEVKSKHKRTQHQQDAIDALMQAVQAELGSEAGFCSSITSPGSGPDGSSSSGGGGGGGGGETLLMYVRDRVVLACAVTQAVPPARLVALSAAVTATDVDIALPGAALQASASPAPRPAAESTPAEPNPNPNPDSDPAPAPAPAAGPGPGPGPGPGQPPSTPTLGIKLVWTAAAARRQGLAARLLDAARRSFEFGRLVRRDHVAFSQPTAAGLGLALGYCRCEWVWGYA